MCLGDELRLVGRGRGLEEEENVHPLFSRRICLRVLPTLPTLLLNGILI
jgi:hypothetical protein